MWLEEVPKDKSLYRCKLCNTERKLSNMGIMALKSHIEGAKHKRLSELDKKSKTRPTSILNFLSGNNSSESSQPAVSQDMPDVSLDLVPTTSTGTIKNSFTFNADDRVKAEVLWVLNMINRNQSFKSSEDSSGLLQLMFPDSTIAKHFTCGEQKAQYMCTFGLKPYLFSLMKEQVKNDDYVLLT